MTSSIAPATPWWRNGVTLFFLWSFLVAWYYYEKSYVGSGEGQLAENFYRLSCPFVEDIVRQEVMKKMSLTFVTVPATLRLFFHDCFVEGCDASVLITSPNGDAEKNSEQNLSLAGDGFDTVIKAKQAVEALCPGVVSCADVLALAARDVVALSGGPSFSVELGRRDGLISQSSRVPGNLPSPDFSLNVLAWSFRKNNLSRCPGPTPSASPTATISPTAFTPPPLLCLYLTRHTLRSSRKRARGMLTRQLPSTWTRRPPPHSTTGTTRISWRVRGCSYPIRCYLPNHRQGQRWWSFQSGRRRSRRRLPRRW
ncbi:uncharacterized protein A4U43_C09F13900 [Asparagus officinalis]|uniref:Peroxidase n=1 Tax=Asparagus officinalis TaxID=4686 RepID=A0A5P1E7G4_ASPOF|nr:uncharacterized protein A4U43_C09F13900 [Asparagus officinalis]